MFLGHPVKDIELGKSWPNKEKCILSTQKLLCYMTKNDIFLSDIVYK